MADHHHSNSYRIGLTYVVNFLRLNYLSNAHLFHVIKQIPATNTTTLDLFSNTQLTFQHVWCDGYLSTLQYLQVFNLNHMDPSLIHHMKPALVSY
jgi:hypothetical protein